MLTSCAQPVDFRFPNMINQKLTNCQPAVNSQLTVDIIELTNVNQLRSLHPTPKVLSGSLASLNRNLLASNIFVSKNKFTQWN